MNTNHSTYPKFILHILFVVGAFIIFSCKKSVVLTPIEFQRQLLAGAGTFQNTQRKWKIDSVHINGTPAILSSIQKNYYKIFVYDGSYHDFDLNEGEWSITTLNKLKQIIVYKSNGRIDSAIFDITKINNYQLKLKLTGSNTEYTFKISN